MKPVKPLKTQKTALVTGGSGDLGQAIALRLARQGCRVWVHAHHHVERAQAVVQAIGDSGGQADAIAFDVSDAGAVQAALEPVLAAGAVDILVNNAGIHDDAAFPAMQAEQWRRVMATNLDGFYNVTQPLTMPMVRQRFGRIISVSSVAAVAGNRGQVNYAAAKGALHSASKALSLELASRNITVNVVAPGIIESRITQGLFDADTLARMVPAKRMGQADEVAALVAFLASDEAGYITGQVLNINGGMI